MSNLPILIILLPLSAALLCLALSRFHVHLGRNVVILSLLGSLLASVLLLKEVIRSGEIHYAFGAYEMPYGIEFVVDGVSGVLIVFVALMAFLTAIFAMPFEEKNEPVKTGGAYTMIALLAVGLGGMTLTGDVFNLYVFLEITSLSGYCLIALGGSRGVVSAFRYMLVGTVAATFYLLGVGILYANTGTLNMADMKKILAESGDQEAMLLAMCFFVAAFGIKMALFPFHGWQPSAYAHAETGTRPLIAGVMGKIPAYALFRYLFCIYGKDFAYFRYFLLILGVLSCAAMIYGSLRAMSQSDIRKLLAYSSVAQIGYISLGFAVGTPIALTGAFLHMIGHGFMKGGLFFAAGSFRYRYGAVSLESFGRIYKNMPLTSGLLVIAALSMVGIPPTVGFFSKWYLAFGAAGAGQFLYVAVLVLSSLLNAVYFFKLIEKVFIQEEQDRRELTPVRSGELPLAMIIPTVTAFLAILFLGILNAPIADVLLASLEGVGL